MISSVLSLTTAFVFAGPLAKAAVTIKTHGNSCRSAVCSARYAIATSEQWHFSSERTKCKGSSLRFDGLVIKSWPAEALAKTNLETMGVFPSHTDLHSCSIPQGNRRTWEQGHSLILHSHTYTATIQNHYIEFQPSSDWWSFNFQWTSFLSSISTLSLSLCSWLHFCLNWLLVITYWWWWWVLIRHSFSHPLQTSVHISGPGVLAMGAALITWPPETTARFKPAPITKILWSKNTTTEYISLYCRYLFKLLSYPCL